MSGRRTAAALASGLLACGVAALVQSAPANAAGGQLVCLNTVWKPAHTFQCSVDSSSSQEAWTINGTPYPYYNGQYQILERCTSGTSYRVDVTYLDSAGQPQADTWSDICDSP